MNNVNYTIFNEEKMPSIMETALDGQFEWSDAQNINASSGQIGEVQLGYIISFTIAFFLIGIIGIVGNILVIFVIFNDKKMRKSLTNMLIVNLAVADSIIMVFGIPEIVQFMLDRGWILGEAMCKIQRSVLVMSLYVSVLTLVALCIERYIAIVFPLKAHILCTRRHTMVTMVSVWFVAVGFGIPTTIFVTVVPVGINASLCFCRLVFPEAEPNKDMFFTFKYMESVIFYFLPLLIQLLCYVIIGKHLFLSVEALQSNLTNKGHARDDNGRLREAIKTRRGVVKMLIASVTIYFLSYSPHQILLIYDTVSERPFSGTWVFVVFVTILAYVNSAANPVIYCIFSQNFRKNFATIIFCRYYKHNGNSHNNVASLNSEYTILLQRRSTPRAQYGVNAV
ncbi:neuropeptide receptor 15-like [Mytilus edulis]|uniref:neuropeptide receptor 15-like n=1 Tax=Mytilus trossulus TaxID=6551 RepID=UPI00300521E1